MNRVFRYEEGAGDSQSARSELFPLLFGGFAVDARSSGQRHPS
jgi:hypothetical protein